MLGCILPQIWRYFHLPVTKWRLELCWVLTADNEQGDNAHDFLAQQTLLTAVQATATAHTPLASKLGQGGVFFKVEGYSLSVLTASSQQLQNEKIKPKKSFLTTKKSPSVAEPMFSIVARFFLKNRRFFLLWFGVV